MPSFWPGVRRAKTWPRGGPGKGGRLHAVQVLAGDDFLGAEAHLVASFLVTSVRR